MNKHRKGFTLIELLVVISIIGLLSSIVLASVNQARIKARNAIRKSDLVQLRNALELYYSTYGSYPSTLSGTTYVWNTSDPTEPHINPTGNVRSPSGGDWIPGVVTAKAIGSLPKDPLGGAGPNNAAGCQTWKRAYLYMSDGKNYKLLSHCAPEGSLSSTDTFNDPTIRTSYAWMVTNDNFIPSGGCPVGMMGGGKVSGQTYSACW